MAVGTRTTLQALTVIALAAAAGFGLFLVLRSPLPDRSRDADSVSLSRARQGSTPRSPLPEPAVPPPPAEDYVGSAVCAECHPALHERFLTHPMGRSLFHVSDVAAIEDYDDDDKNGFFAPPSPRWNLRLRYYATRDGEQVLHHETIVDPAGEPVFDQGVPVHYEVGSGQRGRSYITNRDGILFMSPMSWYSDKGRWDFSPGYNVENLRFERRIVDGCVSCHAGRMAVVEGQPDRYEPEPFLESSIGCERCHGPAGRHVALHREGLANGQADPIVNPAELEPRLRDAVCFQCHLVGKERITRFGRTHFDFRPGDDVTDVWAVFVGGTGIDSEQTTSAVSQVEQMLSSVCYQNSEGRLGCISCHDPHSLPSAESRISFYRSRCVACHDAQAGGAECSVPSPTRRETTAEDSCIHCHMPQVAANDIPHTSQTDHRILRSPSAGRDAAPGDDSILTVFGAQNGRIPQAELDRAEGVLMVKQAERYRSHRILVPEAIGRLEPWYRAAPDDLVVAEALGTVYYLNNDFAAAFEIWDRVLEQNPRHESVLRRLMVVCHDHGRLEQGVDYGRRLVEVNPWNHMYFGRLAHMLGQHHQLEEGARMAERSVELNPSSSGIHGWLSEAYHMLGQPERSAEHQRLFDVLRPQQR